MNAPTTKLAYTVKEIASLTPFGERTIWREIAAKRLLARKCGSRTLVLAEDLNAFLAALPAAGEEPTNA